MAAAREYKNAYFMVRAFEKGKNLRSTYSLEELDEIFKATPFDKMPIVLNAYRNEYYGQVDLVGTIPVGYITGFDSEQRVFSVMIMEKYAEEISKYEDPIVYPRVKVKEGKVEQVLGMDICNSSYYANIYR